MFETHSAGDGIEKTCSFRCLTLLGDTNSTENRESPQVAREKSLANAVPDPPIELLPRIDPMAALNSTMQPILVICVEILRRVLVSEDVMPNSMDDRSSRGDVTAEEIAHDNVVGVSVINTPEVAGNRGKRLFEDVDYDKSQLDDDAAKRVRENENAEESNEVLLNVSFNENEWLELSPSQLLQMFIDADHISVSWNSDDVTANEVNNISSPIPGFDAETEDDCALEIASPESRT